MGSGSKEARERWRREQERRQSPGDTPVDKRDQWNEAKRENEKVHLHFMCNCLVCAQEFAICGLPCFVICPNCHNVLKLRFS